MTIPTIGTRMLELDTPCLIVDLDAFERNISGMADWCAANEIKLRAHAKTHKSVDIAKIQIAHGAVGQCCQKVSEAEILVDGGIQDVMVSNQIIGHAKCARLAQLATRAKISVCVDSEQGVADLAEAVWDTKADINVLVEIDVGGRRCGVPPGEEAVALADMITNHPHLKFGGLQSYNGSSQHLRTAAERQAAFDHAFTATTMTRDRLAEAGFQCTTIGGGGTGSYTLEGISDLWTELQCGSYIFMDADYARNSDDDGKPKSDFEHALFVLSTVMSRASDTHAVLDAGHKSAAIDSGLPTVWNMKGVSYARPSDEHGVLKADGSARCPELGDQVLLVPGHCDPTVNLHDHYIGVRGLAADGHNAVVECIWPVSARGALT